MRKSNVFKQDLLRWLLAFCYPDDYPGITATGIPEDPRIEPIRKAVIDTLRAYVSGSRMSKEAFTALQSAYNEPVKLIPAFNQTNPPKQPRLFMVKPTFEQIARRAAEGLHRYLSLHTGPPFPFVCKTCEKVTELTKPNRTFCSEKCRNDFWNSKKMEAYHREKKRQKKARKRGKS